MRFKSTIKQNEIWKMMLGKHDKNFFKINVVCGKTNNKLSIASAGSQNVYLHI